MTTISPTQGTISSAGIGSGLDVNSIISSLMAVESLPLTALQTKATGLQTDLSAFGQVQSLVSALQDAAKPLYDPNTFKLTNTSSADPSSVSAVTSGSAVPGNYTLSVSSLSAAQSVVSPVGQFTDGTSVVGTGSLTIRLGSWSSDNSSFTPATGSSDITIPIGASENTLAGIRDKINAANAGVSATIVTDASGARLAIQSSSTGSANGFRISVADDDGNNADASGLSRLAYDPASSNAQMTLAQAAANTQATINGIAVTTASNSLSGVIDGITFNLGKTTTQPVTVTVTQNTDAIKADMTALVSAFNALNTFMAAETKYDPTTNTAAPLQGDSTAVSIQNQMHSLLAQTTGASSIFSTLTSMGVRLQTDGSLTLDDATWNAAAANLPELTKALSNVDATNSQNNGFGKRFSDWTTQLLQTGGTLTGKTAAIQASITQNQKDQTTMNTQLAATQARLQAQYTALDSTMSQANALAAYVQQQFYAKSSFGTNSSNSN
ncbi:MAG TPA: flagellar filament capping protein FliD [Caldimonas sp.]|nr:flagellar filament capping protein FliD [Caldimonas sp.]